MRHIDAADTCGAIRKEGREDDGATKSSSARRTAALQRFSPQHAAGTHEVASAEVMDGLQVGVVLVKQPMPAGEDARVGRRGDHLAEAGVVGIFGMRLADQPAFQPGGAAASSRGMPSTGPRLAAMPWRSNLSSVRPLVLPSA